MNHQFLIAEDHPLLRHGLRALLATVDGYSVVGEAADGREAVHKTLHLQPDVAMIDLSLPGITGIDVVIQIRHRLPRQRLLALGEPATSRLAGDALRAGCLGFVNKDSSPEEMLLAVRTVIEGRRYVGQDLAGMLLDGMLSPDAADSNDRRFEIWDRLSSRERSVFKLIAEGRTNRSTGDYLNLSAKTVEKYRASLMRKLNLNSVVELTLLAVELGLVERPAVRYRPVEYAVQPALK